MSVLGIQAGGQTSYDCKQQRGAHSLLHSSRSNTDPAPSCAPNQELSSTLLRNPKRPDLTLPRCWTPEQGCLQVQSEGSYEQNGKFIPVGAAFFCGYTRADIYQLVMQVVDMEMSSFGDQAGRTSSDGKQQRGGCICCSASRRTHGS